MIVFENAGEIDIRSITSFGVSVKEGDSPIGFFGTGLKYAIAVLLRTSHSVEAHSGLQVLKFGVSTEEVRGKPFDFVTLQINGGQPQSLGFTTELGKQWEVWMAYRELACNCKDESGQVGRALRAPAPAAGETHFMVVGDAMDEVFSNSAQYLLEDEPQIVLDGIEVRRRPSNCAFYRGVRVSPLGQQARFTYNATARLALTEDRTLKSDWDWRAMMARAILKCEDAVFLREILTARDNTYEGNLDLHGWGTRASDTFIKVVGELIADRLLSVNETALKVWKDATKKEFEPTLVPLTPVQQMALEKALDFCAGIGFPIRGSYPIKAVETLGEHGLGLANSGTIFIAERVFHQGTKQIASTLIEEYVHLKHGWKDCTRELQTFLFDKVVSLGEELAGEPI